MASAKRTAMKTATSFGPALVQAGIRQGTDEGDPADIKNPRTWVPLVETVATGIGTFATKGSASNIIGDYYSAVGGIAYDRLFQMIEANVQSGRGEYIGSSRKTEQYQADYTESHRDESSIAGIGANKPTDD